MIARSELEAIRIYAGIEGTDKWYRRNVPRLLDHIAEQAVEIERVTESATGWCAEAANFVDEIHRLEAEIRRQDRRALKAAAAAVRHIDELVAKIEQRDARAIKAATAAERHIDELMVENVRLREVLQGWRDEYRRWTVANSANSMNPELRPHLRQLQIENERLREALQQAESKCRRLVGTSTNDNHIAILDECRICHAQFSSREPTREQRHREGCPFALLEK